MKYGTTKLGTSRFSGESTEEDGDETVEDEFTPLEQELIESIEADDAPSSVYDRFDAHLKPPFKSTEDSQWDKFLDVLAQEFEDWIDTRNEMHVARYIDTADGVELDRIGEFVGAERRSGERDAHYRARLKVEFHVRVGSGTIDDVIKTSALLLDTARSNITVSEDFDTEAARFNVEVPAHVIDNSGVTVDEYGQLLENVRAAGVRVRAQTKGTFTYRSESDFRNRINDTDKGYSGLGTNVGGSYSGLI